MTRKPSSLAPGIVHRHFCTHGEEPDRQLLAWRSRVEHIVDVPISRIQLDSGFSGVIDSYAVNDILFTDSRTDPQQIRRSIARISTDDIRRYAFYVFMDGGEGYITGSQRDETRFSSGILALDLNQPFRIQRPAGKVLNFFAPRALVESGLPDAESLHGRVVESKSALMRIIYDHLDALSRGLPTMSASEAESALRCGIQLMVAAFGKQAKLSGNARAAARAAMFGQVRRFIGANLHKAELSPESLLNRLQLPRSTLYRMFEHEGGLDAYIRNRRLREAADDLVRHPHLAVTEIAYGNGFRSASDFTRAFRRAYDMAPQDLRAHAVELQHAGRGSTAKTEDGE
jgi:AraC-like DNA-binding protein